VYFTTDPSNIAALKEEFYFNNVRAQINGSLYYCPDLTETDRSLREFREFSEEKVSELGYLVFLNYSYDCNQRIVRTGILVASERYIICQNINVTQLLPSSQILSFQCS
jgi:hypothetical protein